MMTTSLQAGSTISFSAGSTSVTPDSYRVIAGTEDRLLEVLEAFPFVAGFLNSRPPMIVSCYPATLGSFGQAVFVDTYLREVNFNRALILAAREGMSAFVLGQPLAVAHFMLKHLELGLELPDQLLFFVGGYPCPASLEHTLLAACRSRGVRAAMLHAYGMAEVDYGVFVGQRQGNEGVGFRQVARSVEARIEGGRLMLRKVGAEAWTDSGDMAARRAEIVEIVNAPERVHPEVMRLLETWTVRDWGRRNGYLGRQAGKLVMQLRQGVQPEAESEMEYFAFCRAFGGALSEKPCWGMQLVTQCREHCVGTAARA